MDAFKIVPNIENYDHVEEFLNSMEFNEKDFLFISKSVYTHYFENKVSKAKVYFRSAYGQGEPNSDMADALLKDFMESGCKRIIAVGGGSVMDMAKLLCVCKKPDVHYIFEHKEELQHIYPLILIPTTCGSGSEVSNISIVEMLDLKTKLGLAHDSIYADTAVLIPELLESVSHFYLTTSAIDGLVHAIESYLSSRSNVYTRLFQEKSISLYVKNFKKMIEDKSAPTCYEELMTASNMAGISFGNTGTGCVHAISYPLSGTYHVTHGLANSIFLVAVLKMYDRLEQRDNLIALKQILANEMDCDIHVVFDELDAMLHALLEVPTLSSLGMKEEEIETFSESVIQNQQRLMSNGYINLDKEQVKEIYRLLF